MHAQNGALDSHLLQLHISSPAGSTLMNTLFAKTRWLFSSHETRIMEGKQASVCVCDTSSNFDSSLHLFLLGATAQDWCLEYRSPTRVLSTSHLSFGSMPVCSSSTYRDPCIRCWIPTTIFGRRSLSFSLDHLCGSRLAFLEIGGTKNPNPYSSLRSASTPYQMWVVINFRETRVRERRLWTFSGTKHTIVLL